VSVGFAELGHELLNDIRKLCYSVCYTVLQLCCSCNVLQLQCVTLCCSCVAVANCVALCVSLCCGHALSNDDIRKLCCSVLQRVAVRCGVCCSLLKYVVGVLQCVLQCVAA